VKFTARLPGTNVNVSPTHPLKEFAVLAGGLLALIVGVYLILGLAVDLIVPHISMRLEQKIAGAFNARITDSEKFAGATRSLQALVDRLQAHCAPLPYHIRVHVLPSDAVNAAALPGGNMIVFSGLLKKMTSENELAFVLAHELGHFAHRDHLRALGRALVLMTVSAVLLGANNSINRMIGNGLALTDLSFSRRQETRADEFALKTIDCYYGNAAGATTFFRSIPKAQDPGRYGHYFASHPENRRRIAHLEDLIAEHGYPLGRPRPLHRGLVIPEK
jgi:Zn-dependent protease with chaperone function